MLTKEEYEKALNSFCDNCKYGYDCKITKKYNGCVQMNTLNQLIKEHFEILEVLKDCGFGELTSKGLKVVIEAGRYSSKKLNELRSPQPYKFEDLKKGMWVWDDGEKCCFKCNPAISTDMAQCVTYNAFWYNCGEDEDEFFEEYDEFEEGRFFPVIKAMEYQK